SGATFKDAPVASYANNNDTDLYKFLIQLGFDINLIDSQTGRNSLHFSAMYGYEQLSNLLLENEINFQLKDKWGHTAYDLAKTNSHHKIMELIDKHKADNNM
ncbi:MAG: ankyrin repeat domain-containing protein, partial [Bacteroidia bacterium]